MNLVVLFLSIFCNLWIWRIFSLNSLLFLVLIFSSLLIIFSHFKRNTIFSLLFLGSLFLLIIFQYKYTKPPTSLTLMTNNDIYIKDTRMKEYPPVKISAFGKTLWLPVAHWFEERKEIIAIGRIANNFSEIIDLNLYFFANHPRERVAVNEFEKFPYLFLPFFIYGILKLNKRILKIIPVLLFCIIIFLSFIGNKNELGPFILFPFFALFLFFGFQNFYFTIRKKYRQEKIIILTSLFVLLGLVMAQLISYVIV